LLQGQIKCEKYETLVGIPIRLCVRESTLRARGPFSEELGTAVRLLWSNSSSWKHYRLCTM